MKLEKCYIYFDADGSIQISKCEINIPELGVISISGCIDKETADVITECCIRKAKEKLKLYNANEDSINTIY